MQRRITIRMFPVIRRPRPAAWLAALPVAVILGVLALVAGTADAHGILQRSSPRANAVLPSAPDAILLEFNEAIDPRLSRAEVVGPPGDVIARGGEVSGDSRRLRIPLGRGGAGAYVVRWRVLSVVDGHIASGSFVFAVGAGTALTAASKAPAAAGLPPAVVLARWFSYAAALLLAGSVLFDAAVLRWSVRQSDPAATITAGGGVAAAMRSLRMAAAVLTLVALGLEFLVQAAHLAGAGLAQIARRELLSSLLVQTKVGWSLLLRAYAVVLLLLPDAPAGRILRAAGLVWLVVFTSVIVFLGGPSALGSSHVALIVLVGSVYGLASLLAARIIPEIRDVRIPAWPGASVAAAVVLLAGFTLNSHAAGRAAILAASDWLHLAAAATWLGGLPALLLILRTVPRDARLSVGRLLVPRVSAGAGLALLVIGVTGVAASWTLVGSVQSLLTTPYGRSLLLKLALVAGLVVLGALHRFVLRPRIASRRPGALEWFRVTAAVEAALGAGILLVVAALTITLPAATTAERAPDGGLVYAGFIDGERVVVHLSPATAGINDLSSEGPVTSILLRHLGTLREVRAQPDGTVELEDGWWEVVVSTARGQGTFPLVVGLPPAESDPDAAQTLARARARMGRVRTWREIEQLTDGSGGAAVTVFEMARPDRLRYRTASGSEAVIIGAARFSRDPGGTWARDQLPQPLALEGPYVSYLDGATGVRFGAQDRCAAESCRIVLWALPSGQAQFAAWVGRSGRIYQVAMAAPAHYMISRVDRLDAPLRITPP